MEYNLFDINNFNIIQDEENYYFFRALNMADNNDIEQGITASKSGKIERIRTDRERFEGTTKYREDSELSLEEVYDHIKMHYRKDTNCISLTSNSNVAVNYGRGSYKDRYVMIKIPKKEFGEKTVSAGQYMIQELYSRIQQEVENLPEEEKGQILSIFDDIEEATESKTLQDIIAKRYSAKTGEVDPSKAHLRKGITYSSPKARISSYQSLDEEQLLEVNKVYAKLAILENEDILKYVIPHSSNSKLRETIGNAFSSTEIIHYGDINEENIIEIPKEAADIFALIQQVNGTDKAKVEELKRTLIIAVQNGSRIPQISEITAKVKDNISIEEMYELTEGKVEYGKANSVVKNMFYVSKSRQNAISLANSLAEILGKNSGFEDVIEYIRENGFRVEPEIISRQSGKGVKISESVNLNLQNEEQSLIDEIKGLSSDELDTVLQNGGLYNARSIITKTFSNISENEIIDKSRYYAEAVVSQYNWQDIGIEEFKTDERNELIARLQEKSCERIYERLKETGMEESKIPTVLFNIAMREGFYEEYENGNLEELLSTRQDILQNNINIEIVERFLGYYDVENTGIRLKDYQQRAYNNINKIFEDRKFAQVILPTGAGKSFVVLAQMQKYAQEHPNEKMLYLAPQDEILNQIKKYIVKYVHGKQGTLGKTEDEIIKEIFPNITFETYSGLLAKRGQEVVKEQYGMIILDELHRTGAKEWEGKVNQLFENQNDDVKVLGITATPTRDVDGRDMAEETAKKLGYTDEEISKRKHLASNMTLENAIRMGYVVNPKLVYCKYDLISSGKMDEIRAKIYDIEDEVKKAEELKKYNQLRAKLNKEIDDEIGEEARKKLEEEARKNLDSGIGKEEILRQNVKKGGKYIVFIPVTDQGEIEDEDGNRIGTKTGEDKIKAYQEYLNKVFEGTDIVPDLHSILGSYNTEKNKKELDAFESDNSDKTKFMVVMNKANEGIHIDGVDGIIWFRALDENSRILYLQQLGRAIYALDEDNPLPDDKRPIVIDLANNSLTVKIDKEFENSEPIDDLEALTIVTEWINEHNGMIPDRNSSNKQEQHYYAVLRRIQSKYSKYLEGFDNFNDLTEEDKIRIEEIIDLATEIDLWNIDLPPIPKTRENNEDINPFEVSGVLRDYVEIDRQIDIINKIDDFEIAKQYIEFLKSYSRKPSPTFRRNGVEIKKISEMTPEQRLEKRLYSRWNETLIRRLVDDKIQNPLEEIKLEYSEVVEEITELILQIQSKENIDRIQEYITFLESYHRKPQICFKKNSRELLVNELTESQMYEKRLASRWKNSEVKKILDTYADRPISDVPKYYRDVISKLRELGELGEKKEKRKVIKRENPIEEEILEFLNKYNRMPLSAICKNNKQLTTDEMTDEEKNEVNLYGRWKRCEVKKYILMELSEVPKEYRSITSAIARKISDIKIYDESIIARKYIEFLTINMRIPSNMVTRNKKQISVSEMTDEEQEEVNLANRYRKSEIKKTFEQFENGEIDNLPEMWMDIYNQISTLLGKIDIVEKTRIAKEYIAFVEKHGRCPRQKTSGKKQLKRHLKSNEQADEESLARRWSNSYIKTVFDKYFECPDLQIPEEYREVFSRLIELGLKSSKKGYDIEKNIEDQIIEFLNQYKRMPRGAIFKNGKCLTTSEMSIEEQEERNLYGRWNASDISNYINIPLEEVPERYREKIEEIQSIRNRILINQNIQNAQIYINFLLQNNRCPRSKGEETKIYKMWYRSDIKIMYDSIVQGKDVNVPNEYKEVISQIIELHKKFKKMTGKEIAEASISSLTDIEMSDREGQELKALVEKTKEGGINLDEQS